MRKHQLIIVILALALVSAACGDRTLPGAQAGAETLPTTTTTTTTTPPTTTTSSTTTTSTTSTTTTTTTTTTVPPVPECVDSFYWGPEDDNIADFGALRGEQDNEDGLADAWVTVAGCLLEIIRVDTTLAGEEATQVFLRFSFSEPGAELEIIRDLYLGLEGGPVVGEVSWWHPKGWVVPVDPDATANETDVNVSGIPTADFVDKLVVGRLYPINLWTEISNRGVSESCEERWLCSVFVELGFVSPYPRGDALHSYDALDFNNQLYQLLLGNDVPEPEFGYGWISAVYLVPVYEPSE